EVGHHRRGVDGLVAVGRRGDADDADDDDRDQDDPEPRALEEAFEVHVRRGAGPLLLMCWSEVERYTEHPSLVERDEPSATFPVTVRPERTLTAGSGVDVRCQRPDGTQVAVLLVEVQAVADDER